MKMVSMVDKLNRYIIAFFQLLVMAHNDLAPGPLPEDTSETTFKIGSTIQHCDRTVSLKSSPQSYRFSITFFSRWQ